MDMYELRQDRKRKDKLDREEVQKTLDIKNDKSIMRKMKFPCFNLKLSVAQYNKIFHNIPFKKGQKKQRYISSARSVKNRAPGYNEDGTLKKP